MSEETIKLAPPFEIVLSENVKARYGYRDAHVDVELRLPAPISTVKESYTRGFEDEYVRALAKALENAALLEKMPPEERARIDTPIVVELGGPVSGKYGFDDGHVELNVKLPFIFRVVLPSGVYTHRFEREEAVLVHDALKKAILWSDLAEDERERMGA
jgi:hypothetical protein